MNNYTLRAHLLVLTVTPVGGKVFHMLLLKPFQKLSFQKWLPNHTEILSRPRSLIFLALVSEDSAEFIKG